MKHLSYLNKYFFKYKYRLAFGVFFVVTSNIFGVLSPQVVRHSFDLVAENIRFYQLLQGFETQGIFFKVFSAGLMLCGIVILLLAALKGLFLFFTRQTIIVMSRLIEYDLKNEIYAHYQLLDLAFYKRNNTGDMMSRVAEDVSRVRMYLGPALMYGINMTVLFIMVVSTMVSVNAELTSYVVLPLPILSFSIYYINTIIHKRSEAIQRQLSHLTSIAQEIYSGIRVVKAYVQQIPMIKYFDNESRQYKERALSLAKIEAFFHPLMLLLIGVSTVLTIYVGGIAVINGTISPGNVAEFVIYVNMLTWPVTAIGWIAAIVQRASASQMRINEFLLTKPTIGPTVETTKAINGNIEFKSVGFTYPDTGITALRNVSFKVNKGERLAIVGKTGSGKTTIAELLVRMYDKTKGKILVEGVEVNEYNLQHLRSAIGYVPQDGFLFSATVEQNIYFGNSLAGRKEAELAATYASIHNEISELPKGYATIVGERGVTLSGGQKQRISIARALVGNPSIILLDDCLSAVDAKTEKNILEHLDRFLKDRTSIIITHRIFTLLNFSRIIVLHDGQIVESGAHDELLKLNGHYAELYKNQELTEKG